MDIYNSRQNFKKPAGGAEGSMKDKVDHIDIPLMRILKELQKRDMDFIYISDMIGKDPELTDKLLKLTNSIYYGENSKINSIEHSLVIMGIDEVTKWISMLLIREFEVPETSELVKKCLLRGEVLLLMSREIHHELSEKDFFLTGILSSIDVILNESMERILEVLDVSPEIHHALLEHSGQLYECLNCVRNYERADLKRARAGLMKEGVTMERFMDLHMMALSWLIATNR